MFARYASAVGTGTLVTLGLLYVMQALITKPSEEIVSTGHPSLTLFRTVLERPVEKRELFEKFEDIKNPVDPTPPRPGPDYAVDSIGVKLVDTELPDATGFERFGGVIQDGPLVAVVRVQPVYPVRAAEQELEGYVDVLFDINTDGTVTNVSVTASSHRIFEKAAINAAKKFRFKARVVDGIPQPSVGIQNRFRFHMERT